MSAKTFEDLIVWQRAKELTKLIYSSTNNGAFQKDFGLEGRGTLILKLRDEIRALSF